MSLMSVLGCGTRGWAPYGRRCTMCEQCVCVFPSALSVERCASAVSLIPPTHTRTFWLRPAFAFTRPDYNTADKLSVEVLAVPEDGDVVKAAVTAAVVPGQGAGQQVGGAGLWS
mgnify:CR=1 FL=1